MPKPPLHPALQHASRATQRRMNRCKPARVVDAQGYPRTKVKGKSVYAHRVAFELFWRKLEPGERVFRTCQDRSCTAYFHLTTTPPERKNRHRPGTTKLTPTKARNIREAYGLPEAERPTQAELAKKYGVTRSNISLIVRRVTWPDV